MGAGRSHHRFLAHPRHPLRGAGPSRVDREGSLRLSTKHPERIDVGIIVTPHPEYRWAAPLPSAYVAQLGKIEPVEIQEVEEIWQ